jgi:hypothetical protein
MLSLIRFIYVFTLANPGIADLQIGPHLPHQRRLNKKSILLASPFSASNIAIHHSMAPRGSVPKVARQSTYFCGSVPAVSNPLATRLRGGM